MKLLLVSDHAPLRDATMPAANPASAGWQSLHAGTVAEAHALLEREPDTRLVLADLDLPDAADAVRHLHQAAPAATLIAASADERRGTVMGAISARAAGFVGKSAEGGAMRAGVRIALEGGIPLPVALLERRTPDRPGYGTWTPAPRTPDALGYSAQEAEVLRLFVQGRSEAVIVHATGLTDVAVKAHLAAIFRRLGTSVRSQVVLESARLGLRFGPGQGAAGARASSIASP